MSTYAATSNAGSSPILVASSNEKLRRQVVHNLNGRSCQIQEANGGADALCKLESGSCRVLLLDPNLADLHSDELIVLVESKYPGVDVVLLDEKTGQPIVPPELAASPRYRALGAPAPATAPSFARTPFSGDALPGIIGGSEAMQRIGRMVRRVASRTTTVLITGETGTGKELVAQAIHQLSPRAARPFVTVNCAAIPEPLLESELFGYARGAFTGAVQAKLGRIHAAQGGTLFLDEIGEMPAGMQAKLLRFLETGEVQRLGSTDVFRVDVRVVAATNLDLKEKVASREFREDLYYRLAVFPIELPALVKRGEDLKLLTTQFLEEFAGADAELTEEAEEWIAAQPWRGNVRELRHALERASILWDGDSPLGVELFNLSPTSDAS